MYDLLKLLENDARLTPEALALMLNKETGDIRKMIYDYEKQGVILGYRTEIDWDKTSREYVSAMIELKITPQRDRGFDHLVMHGKHCEYLGKRDEDGEYTFAKMIFDFIRDSETLQTRSVDAPENKPTKQKGDDK